MVARHCIRGICIFPLTTSGTRLSLLYKWGNRRFSNFLKVTHQGRFQWIPSTSWPESSTAAFLPLTTKTTRGNCDNHKTPLPRQTTHTPSLVQLALRWAMGTCGGQGAPSPAGIRTELIPTRAQTERSGRPRFNDQLCPYVKSGKGANILGPQFPHLQNRSNEQPSLHSNWLENETGGNTESN